jgi:hypothetical protein
MFRKIVLELVLVLVLDFLLHKSDCEAKQQ